MIARVTLMSLLLSTWFPAALVAQTEPRPPVIMIPGEADESEPVHVQSLDVSVEIVGYLAETTLVMTFHNPNDRILSGELLFPLPEGATISGFGLDVGGELVDGVAIERHQARVAFEAEMIQQVDPGLAEWVQGSLFRTRIYPFPANGNRTIRVSYLTELTVVDGAATFDLPLAYQGELDRFHLRVAVSQGAAQPTIQAGEIANLTFESWEQQYVAETTLTDFLPHEDIHVAVPLELDHAVVELHADDTHYFVAQHRIDPSTGAAERLQSARVAIVLDASASRDDRALLRERQLIASWAEANPNATIDLVVLRDRTQFVATFAPGPSRDVQLDRTLAETPRDGGTDLQSVRFTRALNEMAERAPSVSIDLVLLLSDGLGSLGAPSLERAEVPVIAVSASTSANHAWLEHVATTSGGASLNLTRMTDEAALAALSQMPLYLGEVAVVYGNVSNIEILGRLAADGQVLVSGCLDSDDAIIELRYFRGDTLVQTSPVALSTSGVAEGRVAGVVWAQSRIARLAIAADRYAEELLEIGTTFNLVTPSTSYLVLETLEQHLEHEVPPAPTRLGMLEEYWAQMATRLAEKEETESQRVEIVVASWEGRVNWWEANSEMRPGLTPLQVSSPSRHGEELTVGPPAPEAGFEVSDEEDLDSSFYGGQGLGGGGTVESEQAPNPAVASTAPRAVSGGRPPSGSGAGPGGTARERPGVGSPARVSSGSTIAIQAWRPDTPYLNALRSVSADDAYEQYLDQVSEFGRSPAFYLDVASYFYDLERSVEARRILTNIAEMDLGDARLLRIVAYKLQDEGDLDLAIRLFEEVLTLRPEEPQSPRDLAIALSQRGDRSARNGEDPMDDWARSVELIAELTRSDLGRFRTIELPALMEANRVIASMERYAESTGLDMPFMSLDGRLRGNLDMDVRVLLRWDTDQTDMDLHVVEPSGEEVYYGHTSSRAGATYGRDYTGGYGPEEYLLRRAPDGGYAVSTHFFGSRQQSLTGGTTLQLDLFTDWGRPTEERYSVTVRLQERGQTVAIGTVNIGDGEASWTGRVE